MRLRRALDVFCALFLLTLAAAKVASETPTFLSMGAAITEGGLGILFLLGRLPRFAALALVLMGLFFSAATILGTSSLAAVPCGCVGDVRLSYIEHVSLALSILLLGSIQCSLQGARRERPAGIDSQASKKRTVSADAPST